MKLIQTQTLTSAQPNITFSAIPQNFTDLYVLTSIRSTRPGPDNEDSVFVEFNGVTTGYTSRNLRGDGSSATSQSGSTALVLLNQNSNNTTANSFSNASIYIPNYAGSTNKSGSIDSVMEWNNIGAFQNIIAFLWSNTDAITSIKFRPNVGPNFAIGTMISLYGVTKGSDGIVTTSQ